MMQKMMNSVLGVLRPTPAKSFLVGVAFMQALPDFIFGKLSIAYHDITQDNTYLLEDSQIALMKTQVPDDPTPNFAKGPVKNQKGISVGDSKQNADINQGKK